MRSGYSTARTYTPGYLFTWVIEIFLMINKGGIFREIKKSTQGYAFSHPKTRQKIFLKTKKREIKKSTQGYTFSHPKTRQKIFLKMETRQKLKAPKGLSEIFSLTNPLIYDIIETERNYPLLERRS